jgi:hypothetical protein
MICHEEQWSPNQKEEVLDGPNSDGWMDGVLEEYLRKLGVKSW